MAPRVLISDKLSEAAVQIFRDRGVEVDYLPDLGKDKDALLAKIGMMDLPFALPLKFHQRF
jgi:D-3-phosphoglycerate dehydrogenase / 2-oxoglutarate reductase